VTTDAIAPHGGTLVNRVLEGDALAAARERAKALRTIAIDDRVRSDLEMIATGGLSPLTGFMDAADHWGVVDEMRLADGTLWAIPVTLPVSEEEATASHDREEIVLAFEGDPLAILRVESHFRPDKEREAQKVYGTTDAAHPGVAYLMSTGPVCLAGDIQALGHPARPQFPAYHRDPASTREIFRQRGWRTICAFQTRNPVHRAHEYLQKCAMEMVDALLLHPLVGATKGDDIPADVRMRCYEALLKGYYPDDRVLLSVFPAAMRYAGPREAVWHAIARKNYGCTHFIVGRDHAGVGSYYGTYDAQKIFETIPAADLGIVPIKFDNSFFCRTCGNMASEKTCPHPPADRVSLSGTRVREMLKAGELPPAEFTRPEVAKILIEASRG